MNQLALLTVPAPAQPDGIDLRCCDVADMLPTVSGARLMHADPPWLYFMNGGLPRGVGQKLLEPMPYSVLPMDSIVAHLVAAHAVADTDAYLLLWCTWPKLGEWMEAAAGLPWTFKSGACWGKTGRLGVGFHWRGDSEPLLLYVKGNPRPLNRATSNLHMSARQAHSEKPSGFLRTLLGAFTAPDDLVVDLYAGLAPMARACALEGRRYVGAEIDPDRWRQGVDRLALRGVA